MTYRHPIRDAKIHVFERVDDDCDRIAGANWIAQLHPYDKWPIQFRGDLRREVEARAQSFIDETIERHEAAAAKRSAALEKARAAKKEAAA